MEPTNLESAQRPKVPVNISRDSTYSVDGHLPATTDALYVPNRTVTGVQARTGRESRVRLSDPSRHVFSVVTGADQDIGRKKSFNIRSIFHVSDNRLSHKLFGSRRGVKQEVERMKKCHHCVIHPCSPFRLYWDLAMVIILMLNVILLPISISFFKEGVNPAWLTLNSISDIVFVIDIILNFWTGIITNENTVIIDLRKIRRHYAKRWLAIDVLSVFPFDYTALALFETQSLGSLLQASRALRLLRLIKFLSLLRLFRVLKFLHYLSKWEELFNATRAIARIVKFILAVLLLAHWNGCIQFLVPFIQGFPSDSWVSINNLEDAPVGKQYSWALFKAFSHMLCIGFGKWPPQNTTEVWITIISMLIGASLYAMFIGHISTLIHSVNSASRDYNEKLKQVEEYMRYRKLPIDMKHCVHEYYYQRYHGQLFDEEAILTELSHSIRERIVSYNCQELVRVVPFFAEADDNFIRAVVTRLSFDVFLPGDYIIHCGAMGRNMYFIQQGIVDIITSDGNVAATLCDGAYFGEICLLMKCRRVASVRAVTVCDIYCLCNVDFENVLDEFPHMRTLMETVARERLTMISTPVPGDRVSQSLSSLETAQHEDTQLASLHEHYIDPADIV